MANSAMLENTKVHFPGLNGLRFFAAMAVVITHIELIKKSFGLVSFWNNPLIFELGSLGVNFFFVLSGFLITYLLLEEKKVGGTVSVKKFYLRRILRIWPLYFLIVFLGFFVLPQFNQINISYLTENFSTNFFPNLILYLFMLPNLAFSLFFAVPHIGQLWSIGVEEQFYLFWPWLIKRSKNILKSLILVFACFMIVKVIYVFLPPAIKQLSFYEPLKLFLAMTKMELMAIGGIGAYFLFKRNRLFLSLVFSPIVFVLSFVIIPALIFLTPSFLQDGIHIVYSILFLIIIINVSSNPNSLLKLDKPFFNYFGNISFGIYMYHMLLIPICLLFLKPFLSENLVYQNVVIYLVVIGSTLVVSALSYALLERRFIKLKSRFEVVKTT